MVRQVMPVKALLLGTLLLTIAACSSGRQPAPARLQGQVIIGMSQEPDSLNPAISNLEVARSVEYAVLEPLWMANEQGEFVPKLAAAVPEQNDVSADGKTYTIKIRQGVRWHDGQPFTSKDVKFTFELMQNPKVKIANRSGFKQMTSVETPDDQTVKFTLDQPFAPIMTILADTYILPEHILGKSQDVNTDPFNARPVGTGPFKLVDWQRGQAITVQANPDYGGGPPGWRKPFIRSCLTARSCLPSSPPVRSISSVTPWASARNMSSRPGPSPTCRWKPWSPTFMNISC